MKVMDSSILCSSSQQLFTVAPSNISSLVGNITRAQERICLYLASISRDWTLWDKGISCQILTDYEDSRSMWECDTKSPPPPPPTASPSPPPSLRQKLFSLTKFQWFQGRVWCLLSADNTVVFHKGCRFLFVIGLVKLLTLFLTLYQFTFFIVFVIETDIPLTCVPSTRVIVNHCIFWFSFSFTRFHNYSEILLRWHSADDER